MEALTQSVAAHDDEIRALKSRVHDLERRLFVLGDVVRKVQEFHAVGDMRPPCACGSVSFEKIDPDTFQCTMCKAQYYDR